jgi:hypothetical protein
MVPGLKVHLLKGDRGVRAGRFLVFLEIESLEAPDWYFPGRARSRRSSLGSLNSTQKLRRHWRNDRNWAPIRIETDVSTDYVAVAE